MNMQLRAYKYTFRFLFMFWVLFLISCVLSEIVIGIETRIKDMVYFEGVRDNILVGYGLVVGLNGTGDNLNNSAFTESTLRDRLARMGVNSNLGIGNSKIKTKNIAAVMVTADLLSFLRKGSRLNVKVSTIGDAKNIRGGVLLATPLIAADGNVYALAQGEISIPLSTDNDGGRQKQSLTTGVITDGAIIEKEVGFNMNNMESLRLSLKNPDITTVNATVNAINSFFKSTVAIAEDPGTVKLIIPQRYKGKVLELLADIENLAVSPDQPAKIVIDERSGTVVIGENVKIGSVAISQGNLVIKIGDEDEKLDFLKSINEKEAEEKLSDPGTRLIVLKQSSTLNDLVHGLNALGVKTFDLISILKAIQQVGALQAKIEIY